ncbi:hypothetical protein SDC9_159148 [bioreactor metagenome]|uniref:Uncharacterized protein n=1 Tax=bioreactor metagenome TaxID=1076179 RepID=A0A645FD18_9ZZZZ
MQFAARLGPRLRHGLHPLQMIGGQPNRTILILIVDVIPGTVRILSGDQFLDFFVRARLCVRNQACLQSFRQNGEIGSMGYGCQKQYKQQPQSHITS